MEKKRIRLLAILLLFLSIGWGVIVYWYHVTTVAPVRSLTHTYSMSLVKGLAYHAEDWFAARVSELSLLAHSHELRAMNSGQSHVLFQQILNLEGSPYEDLLLVSTDGTVITRSGELVPVSDRDYFVESRGTGKVTVGDMVESRGSGNRVIPIIHPIYSQELLVGYLLATVSVEHVETLLLLPEIDVTHAMILQRNGQIVSSRKHNGLVNEEMLSFVYKLPQGLSEVSMYDADFSDGPMAVISSPIPLVGWTLIIGIDKGLLEAGLDNVKRTLLSMWVLLTTCAGAAVFLGNRMTKQQVILAETEASHRRLMLSFKSMYDSLIVTDVNGRITMMNAAAEQLTSWDEASAYGTLLPEIICTDGAQCCTIFSKYLVETISQGMAQSFRHLIHNTPGKVLHISCSMSPLMDHNDKVIGCVVRMSDETDFERAKQRLSFYRLVAENTRDALLIMDHTGRILEANLAAVEMYGYTNDELLSMSIFDLRDSTTLEAVPPQMQQAERGGILFETIHRTKNGRQIPVEVSSQGAHIEGERVLLSIIRDITDRKKAEHRVRHLSYHDILTGLYNRAFFEDEIKRLDSQAHLPISIIMGDINGLKLVNDTFGHAAGDQLLKEVGTILTRSCRRSDVIARWGGDEFAIILPNTDLRTAEAVCERIRQGCRRSKLDHVKVSIALGAATKIELNQKIGDVLSQAEDRMYRNKLSEQRGMRSAIITSLQQSLAEKSNETEEHAERLQEHALILGERLRLNNNEIDELLLLAKLHDIGKIAVPDDILLKPGPLTPSEWEAMKKHCEIGYRIAQATTELAPIAQTILAHHERWDGRGYPLGLAGEEIPLLARIIAVVDAFDVMTHDRPYKKALSREAAMQELVRHAGAQFDPNVVEEFVKVMVGVQDEAAATSDES